MGKDHLGDLGIDGKILLKSNLKEWVVRIKTGFVWLRIVSSGGLL
jgi:hypothetical protein